MDVEDIQCQVCGAAPIRHRCIYCGRWVCAACSSVPQEPCRGCFELEDPVAEEPRPPRPPRTPAARATAPTVCVDLDGVLAEYDHWRGLDHIGAPLAGAVEFTRRLKSLGLNVVIHTTRVNPDPQTSGRGDSCEALRRRVQAWLDEHGFACDDIFTGQGKPLACAYVDDRAVPCRPQFWGPHEYEDACEGVSRLMKMQSAAGDPPQLYVSPVSA